MATNEQAVRTIPKRTHSYNNAPLDSNNGRRNSNPVTPNDIHVTDTGIVREKQGKVYCDNKPPKVELITNGDFSVESPELITNGDFSDGLTGWTLRGARSATQTLVAAGLEMYSGTAEDNQNRMSETSTPQGYINRTYELTIDASDFLNSSTGYIRLDGVYDSSNIIGFNASTTSVTFQAYRNFTKIVFFAGGSNKYYTVDNISLKELGQDWSLGGGWGIGSGVATHNGSTNANISQNVPLVVGTAYDITYTVVNASAGSKIGIAPNSLNIQYPRTSDGTYTETFTASLTNLYIRSLWNNGNPVSVDNISLSRTVLETEYLYHEVLVRDEFNNLVALVRNSNEGDISTGSYENNQGVKNRPVPRTKTVDGRTSRNIDSNGQPTL
tara:strand:- start:512 stop:1663 length:1152 start_codon:yes stop_codon:yes gene_type:complete